MNCPYCNKEMRKGILDSKGAPIWTTREKLTPFVRKDEVRLGDIMRFKLPAAYYCEECKKIIIDLEEIINMTSMDNGL